MPASRCWAEAIRRAREAIVSLPCRMEIDRTGAVLPTSCLAGRPPVATVTSPFWHSRGATAKGPCGRGTSDGRSIPHPTRRPDRRPRRGSMKIRPLQDRILVRRIEEEETTKGGIIIPDTAKEKPSEGRVIAVGKGKVSDDGKVHPLDVK